MASTDQSYGFYRLGWLILLTTNVLVTWCHSLFSFFGSCCLISSAFSSRTTLATCLSFTNTLLAQTLCTYYKVPVMATLAQPVSWYKSSPKHFEVCLKTLQFDRLWAKSDLILRGWHLSLTAVVTRGLWYNLYRGLTPFDQLLSPMKPSWHRNSAPFSFSELRLLR